jgi:GT2 family glycosyltransferase
MAVSNSKISVVILSYNHPGITKQCVESALSFFENEQIFLVHNGSRLENVSSLKASFPEIHHLDFEDNRGFSGGANRGINFAFENSKMENVLFLSNDTKMSRWDFIPPEAPFLIAPKVELRDTGRVASLGGNVCLWRGILNHLQENEKSKSNFYVPGAAFIVNRKAWSKVKGFDESLGSYWEDVDLSLRASNLNIELGVTKDVVLKHGVAKTTGGDPFYTLYSFHKNRKRIAFRHGRGLQRPLFSLVYTAETMRKLFKFIQIRDFKRAKLLLKATVS